MKKLLKICGIVVGVIVVLLIVAGVYLAAFFDPNDYKDRIAEAVQDSTGRTLVIEGDLALTIFPWLGVEFGAVRLSDPVGFSAPDLKPDDVFLRLNGGKGYVALLPLLGGNVQIREIVIDGLTCTLVRKPDGTANWDFSKPGAVAQAGQTEQPDAAPQSAAGESGDPMEMLKTVGLSNLSVLNASVSVIDHVQGIQAGTDNLSLELKELELSPAAGNLGVRLGSLATKVAALSFSDPKNQLDAQLKDFSLTAEALSGDQALNVQVNKAGTQLGQLAFTNGAAGQKVLLGTLAVALEEFALTPEKHVNESDRGALPPGDPLSPRQAKPVSVHLSGADVSAAQLQYLAGENKLDVWAESVSAVLRAIRVQGPEDVSVVSADVTAGILNYVDPQAGKSALVEGLDAQLKDFFKGAGLDLRLATFTLNSPNITYADTPQNLDVAVRTIAATIKDFAPGRKPQADISASVDSKAPDIAADLKLVLAATEASADLYRFRDVALDVTPRRGLLSPDLGPVALRGNLDIAPKSLDIAFSPLTVSSRHASLEATGSASGAKSSVQGSFKLSAAPAALLKALNMAVPTRDPAALSRLDASFSLNASPTKLDMPDLVLRLDDTAMQAVLAASLGTAIQATADLTVDAIVLDRYLPPTSAPADPAASAASATSGAPGAPAAEGAAVDPVAALKQSLSRVDARAKIAVGSLTFANVPLTNILVEALADRGLVTVNPATLTVGGGQVGVTLTADTRQAATRSDATLKVNNVDVGEVQRLAMGTEYVGSRATADISLNAVGDALDAVKRTLGGKGALGLSKGVLTNITLVPQQVPGIPGDWMAKTGQVFNGMNATFTAEKGVFTNKDMQFLSDLCDITGEGTADLPKNLLDYRLNMSFGKTTHLPARLHGPLNAPGYSIDPAGLVRGILENPDRLLENIGENLDKPENLLRGLFR